MNNYFAASDYEIRSNASGYIPGLLRKYNDLRTLDKLWSSQSMIEDISITMQKNLTKGLENRDQLDVKY